MKFRHWIACSGAAAVALLGLSATPALAGPEDKTAQQVAEEKKREKKKKKIRTAELATCTTAKRKIRTRRSTRSNSSWVGSVTARASGCLPLAHPGVKYQRVLGLRHEKAGAPWLLLLEFDLRPEFFSQLRAIANPAREAPILRPPHLHQPAAARVPAGGYRIGLRAERS